MRLPLPVLCASLLVLSAGCRATLKVGDSHYAPVDGMLISVEAAPYDAVVKASFKAMQVLELRPDQRERDEFRTILVGESNFGRLPQTHEIRVWIKRQSEGATELKLRIVGRRDEDRLRAILAEVEKLLPKSSQPG
jgi:hypothetical protein